MSKSSAKVLILWLAMILGGCGRDTAPKVDPAGAPTSPKTDALKAGATVMQTHAPVNAMNVYIVGFHPMKDDPEHQMEAHHFCRQANEDFAQCALFDGNTATANLTGIEFIISGKAFDALPEAEKRYWHPHNAEILSGQLIAPGIPEVAEKELMRTKMNSYGKTWHVWMTDHGHTMPLGDAMLAWSFNRDGEAKPGLVEERDKRMSISTGDKRRDREELRALARPQHGVDDLKGKFAREGREIPGVVDRRAAPPAASTPPAK
jgi:hypothetical protein